MSARKCGVCGRDPAAGHASINDTWYCHGDDDPEPTCYMQASAVIPLFKGRAQFAEYAEAVGVRTDQVAAVRFHDNDITVIYTFNDNMADRDAIATLLHRNEDGMLVGGRVSIRLPGFFDRIVEVLDELDFGREADDRADSD